MKNPIAEFHREFNVLVLAPTHLPSYLAIVAIIIIVAISSRRTRNRNDISARGKPNPSFSFLALADGLYFDE